MVTSSNVYSKQRVRDSYAFIQGTGLEIVLLTFQIGYNANDLRKTFDWVMKHEAI